MLTSFMKILDRQGILKGDLNLVQRTGLIYLMDREMDEMVALEKVRMENNAITSNPKTSQVYLEQLFRERQSEDELSEELQREGYEVEWHTPTDASEVEDVLRNLGLQVPTESSPQE